MDEAHSQSVARRGLAVDPYLGAYRLAAPAFRNVTRAPASAGLRCPDVENHCCQRMVDAITSTCDQHPDRFDCPDALLDYNPRFREYGLIVHDCGTAVAVIDYCPGCGAKLPVSLRDEWLSSSTNSA